MKSSIFLLLLTLLSVFALVFSAMGEYLLGDIISIFLFFLFLTILWNSYKDIFVVNGYIIFGLSTAILISLLVEKGAYLYEIDRNTYAIGITQKIVIQVIFFFLGIIFAHKIFSISRVNIYNISPRTLNFLALFLRTVVVGLILLMFFIGLKYGTPREHHIHRNDYWAYIGPSWGASLKEYLIQFSFFLGFLYKDNKRKIDVVLYLFLLIAIIYMGERATGIFNALFFFFVPILIKNIYFLKFFTFKRILLISSFLLIMFFILTMSYGEQVSQEDAISKIETRVILQPQMWWALDLISSFEPQNIILILDKYLGFSGDMRNIGTYFLMDLVSDKNLVDYRFETNSTFTLSGFFNNIYFFGYLLGTIINILWGLIIGFIGSYWIKSISTLNIVVSFFAFKLFFKLQGIILGGNTPNLFMISTILFFIICILFLKFPLKRLEN